MPFRSMRQMKYMMSNMPKMAKKWASEMSLKELPNKVMPMKLKKMIEKHGISTNTK